MIVLQELFDSEEKGWEEKSLGEIATFRNEVNKVVVCFWVVIYEARQSLERSLL